MNKVEKKGFIILADQFNAETAKLASKTEKEILQMVNDCILPVESRSKTKSGKLNTLSYYDHLSLSLIHQLLHIRELRHEEFNKKIKKQKWDILLILIKDKNINSRKRSKIKIQIK